MPTTDPGAAPPDGSIIITPAQMYAQLQQDIGAIRTSQQALTDTLGPLSVRMSTLEQTNADHENRIRRLERAVWIAAGVAAAVGSTAGSVLSSTLGH